MKIIIVGCGRAGALLASTLSAKDHTVAIIDMDPASFSRLDKGFRGRALEGVGFDKDVLERAGIAAADAVVATTNDDQTNFLVARIARQYYHVPRVAARMIELEYAPLYQKLGIDVINAVAWHVQQFEHLISPACNPG